MDRRDILKEIEGELEGLEDSEDDPYSFEDTGSGDSDGGLDDRRAGSPPPLEELPDVTPQELRRRGHSYRNFEPEDVDAIIDSEGDAAAREFLDFIESGRWAPLLRALHKAYIPLDTDEQNTLWRRNPDLLSWAGVWARANDQYDPRNDRPDDV